MNKESWMILRLMNPFFRQESFPLHARRTFIISVYLFYFKQNLNVICFILFIHDIDYYFIVLFYL